MSRADADEFVKVFLSEESLQDELNDRVEVEQTDVDEEGFRNRVGNVLPSLGSEHGYDFTAEEALEVFEQIRRDVESNELSEEELEEVAGGLSDNGTITLGLSLGSLGFICAVLSFKYEVEDHNCKERST